MTPRKEAVIVDVDGTLCDITGVLHYLNGETYGFDKRGRPIKNFDKFHEASMFCPANTVALDYIVEAWHRGQTVIIVTARMERHRAGTEQWLRNTIPEYIQYEGPLMRGELDYRPDTDVKRDTHTAIVNAGFDIVGAIDDNPKILELWESLGIPTVEVPRPENDTTLTSQANRETTP